MIRADDTSRTYLIETGAPAQIVGAISDAGADFEAAARALAAINAELLAAREWHDYAALESIARAVVAVSRQVKTEAYEREAR